MKAYWDSLTKEQQGELAGKVGSTPGYLRLVFNGYKKASFVLAKKLEQCTSGAITKSDLRPDITPFLHALCAVAAQILVGLFTGNWVYGAIASCTFFIAGEHTQA
ncbi:helix-turn-helix domain-containing protein [Escherichia coli O8]|nr:helix-turn-helix domain-containing protein [Escherichia coli O8]